MATQQSQKDRRSVQQTDSTAEDFFISGPAGTARKTRGELKNMQHVRKNGGHNACYEVDTISEGVRLLNKSRAKSLKSKLSAKNICSWI